MVQNKLMSIIADEDSVTGFLLGGIGELNKNRESNFLVLIFLNYTDFLLLLIRANRTISLK